MLPRRHRLPRHSFPELREGARASTPHFSLVWVASRGGGCAAIVSKKVARRAVDRHLLKRRMLAVMAPWCGPSRAIVVHAKAGSAALPFHALALELGTLLARTGRIH